MHPGHLRLGHAHSGPTDIVSGMMTGTNIDGFVVGEMLGSGRSGLLRAVHNAQTGQDGVVRVATSDAEDDIPLFIQESRLFVTLPESPELVRTTMEDGTRVHMVVAEPRRTKKLPQAYRTRGIRHAAGAFAITLLFGLGLLAAWFAVQVPKPRVIILDQRPKVAEPPIAAAVAAVPPPSIDDSTPPATTRCVPDEPWRKSMHRMLAGVEVVVTQTGDEVRIRTFRQEAALDIDHATTEQQCALLSDAVVGLETKYRNSLVRCEMTARWAEERTHELDALNRLWAKYELFPEAEMQNQDAAIRQAIPCSSLE
jgi:hypothetical protein